MIRTDKTLGMTGQLGWVNTE